MKSGNRRTNAGGSGQQLAVGLGTTALQARAVTLDSRYPESGVLASGWLVGENVIAGKAALIDAPMGRGHVVLFGVRPQYRAQSYLTFKMFFSALVE